MKKDMFFTGVLFLGIAIFWFAVMASFWGSVMRTKGEGSLYTSVFTVFLFFIPYIAFEIFGVFAEIMFWKNVIVKTGAYKPLSIALAIVCLCLMAAGIVLRVMAVD